MSARLWSHLWPEPELEDRAARIMAGRPNQTIQQAEEAGLVFAFRARCLAILIVALLIVILVPWPRNLYYLGFLAGSSSSGTSRSGCDDTDLRR